MSLNGDKPVPTQLVHQSYPAWKAEGAKPERREAFVIAVICKSLNLIPSSVPT
jgi:hypothetical protein